MENVKDLPKLDADDEAISALEKEKAFSDLYSHLRSTDDIEESFANWEDFKHRWANFDRYNPDQLKELFDARKKWVEIKKYGQDFGDFFEENIWKELDQDQLDSRTYSRLYDLLKAYRSFGYDSSVDFYNSLLKDKRIWNYFDGSIVHNILKFLRSNGNAETADAIVQHINDINSPDYVRQNLAFSDVGGSIWALIQVVGAQKAEEILKSLSVTNQQVRDYLIENPREFEPDRLGLYTGADKSSEKFDINLENQRLSELEEELQIAISRPREVLERDYEGPAYLDDDFGDWGWGDSPSFSSSPKFDSHRIEELTNRVNHLTLTSDVAPTAVSAIQLHMFNYLASKPDASESEIERELGKIKLLSDREKLFSDVKNPLPTIGIELEIPTTTLTSDKIAILRRLQISNYREANDDLHEVNPDYSYSAETQARIIQELSKLHALPIDSSTGKVSEAYPLSLHINFGMPVGISASTLNEYKHEIRTVNDLLVYGYTSTNRILNRKTITSVRWHRPAEPTDKNKDARHELVRLELRAVEFKDYSSFRLLLESQRLVAMLASHIKVKEGLSVTFVEAYLADLWDEFYDETNTYLEAEELRSNQVDVDSGLVANRLDNTDLKLWSRFLVTDYSKKVNKILKEALLVT